MMERFWQVHFILLAALLPSASFGAFLDSAVQKRIDYAREGDGPIVIAAVNDGLGKPYVDGIRLAIDQVNSADNGLLGRPVNLLVREGETDFEDIRGVARSIAANPQVSAVLGHAYSSVAVPASVIYETAQILFMSPLATEEKLTAHGFGFVFRMLPGNEAMASQSASLANLFGYRRIVLLHSRDEYSRNLAFRVENAVRSNEDMDVVFRASFFADETNYRSILGQLNGVKFDAVYLSTTLEAGARIIKQMRELKLEQPIIASDSLDDDNLSRLTGDAGDRVIVPVIYSPEADGVANRRFKERFQEAYGYPATREAAQGYDSVNVLASAIRRAGSTEPSVLATTLHWSPPIGGITGLHAYDPDGNIYGKSYRFKILRFGRWWDLPGVTAPYLLNSFREARRKQALASLGYVDNSMDQSGSVDNSMDQSGSVDNSMDQVATDEVAPDTIIKKTRQQISIERDQERLSLAWELIRFERLGLIVTDNKNSREAEALAMAAAVQNGFEVEVCRIATPQSQEEDAMTFAAKQELAVMNCASQLARTVDALFMAPDSGFDVSLARRLNRALRSYDVPSFAIEETGSVDYGLSLTVTAPEINLDEPMVAARFAGVLKGMDVGDLNEKLAVLPVVHVDLAGMVGKAQLGLRELLLVSGTLDGNSLVPVSVSVSTPNSVPLNQETSL